MAGAIENGCNGREGEGGSRMLPDARAEWLLEPAVVSFVVGAGVVPSRFVLPVIHPAREPPTGTGARGRLTFSDKS